MPGTFNLYMLSLSTALPLFYFWKFSLSWSHNHAAFITKCYSLHTTQIKHSATFCTVSNTWCNAAAIFLHLFLGGWTYLVLLIVITLNRAIMVSLSWYRNHFKYLQIQKMITVINTGDKRLNNEIFQKPPTTTTCLSQF